uniref:Phosphoadenosine phosphosulfate reductase n=1 Tax=Steinernema glaseri TaxID=37863 RepID=A0A1I7YWN3_9BILA
MASPGGPGCLRGTGGRYRTDGLFSALKDASPWVKSREARWIGRSYEGRLRPTVMIASRAKDLPIVVC